MRRIIIGLFAAALGLTALALPVAAQAQYPPQAEAQVGGVSITRDPTSQPPVAVGGVVLTRDAAGSGSTSNALARTGSEAAALGRAAILAIAVGGALVLAARRRPARRPIA